MYLIVLGMLLSMLFVSASPANAFPAVHALSTQIADSEWRPAVDDAATPTIKGDFSFVHDVDDREDFFVWFNQVSLFNTLCLPSTVCPQLFALN